MSAACKTEPEWPFLCLRNQTVLTKSTTAYRERVFTITCICMQNWPIMIRGERENLNHLLVSIPSSNYYPNSSLISISTRMSAFMQRQARGKPPDKGSFPLDHDGDCKELKKDYMRCLKRNQGDNLSCRYMSRKYLQCRMDFNLMAQEPYKTL